MRSALLVPCAAAALAISAPASADQTPIDYYRTRSVSLTLGLDYSLGGQLQWGGLATQFGTTGAAGIFGLGAAARVVVSGIVLGAELGVTYIDKLVTSAVFFPGFLVGYAAPLTDRVALTPAFHGDFLISTAPGSSLLAQLTGELGLEVLLGKHGYIEPVLSMGALQNTGAGKSGDATFVFGVGYRLGVVF